MSKYKYLVAILGPCSFIVRPILSRVWSAILRAIMIAQRDYCLV